MSKKLVVLFIALVTGWLWAQEASTSNTSTALTEEKRATEPLEGTSSTSTSSTQKTHKSAIDGVQAYFAPHAGIMDKLSGLLANTKRQVLVAMYLLNDDIIVQKLITLKIRHRIDVQIIFDETSLGDVPNLVSHLIENNILPIVYPSQMMKPSIMSLMHNKFLVIDNAIVLTGSANFSKSAFRARPTDQIFNYENIVIIRSDDIAQDYQQAFSEIKEKTLNNYVSLFINRHQLPSWMNILLPKLYREESSLKEVIYNRWAEFSPNQKIRLQTFFGWRPSTLGQNKFLLKYNIPVEGMPFEYAYKLIGDIIKQEKEGRKLKRKLE